MYLFFSKLNTIQNTLSLSCLIIYLKKPNNPPPPPPDFRYYKKLNNMYLHFIDKTHFSCCV